MGGNLIGRFCELGCSPRPPGPQASLEAVPHQQEDDSEECGQQTGQHYRLMPPVLPPMFSPDAALTAEKGVEPADEGERYDRNPPHSRSLIRLVGSDAVMILSD